MSEYWETYAGPEYVIENNQAAVLNFVLTCFMYGTGVPILFPIALVCLVILYVFEKKMITRQVRIPANFDPKMNMDMVSVFLNGPILYAGIGFWMYSVPALMTNDVQPISHLTSKNETHHLIMKSLFEISPATPFLILFVIAVFARYDHHTKVYKNMFESKKFVEIIDRMKERNVNINPDFYDALSKKDRELLLRKEFEL